MTLRSKSLVLFALVWALALWVPIQHLVVARYGMNQWKFAGWAMYCKPAPQVFINLRGIDRHASAIADHPVQLQDVGSRIGQGELVRLQELRKLWGDWYTPDRFARHVLSAYPRLTGLRIYINTVVMNGSSAMAEYVSSTYDCVRTKTAIARCTRRPRR